MEGLGFDPDYEGTVAYYGLEVVLYSMEVHFCIFNQIEQAT